ncbi:MAG: class II D-tagatose-bisphosphate aldolase, non-catalytic subunit [Treponema sp.]|jgi:D-tagatose-1,6-bisphosphate aldolase subunit GatZ/KbaZ|nr:class II D-tagatose-bisphosphate aldolase, non-catalytic subunit [Treponema sp.]
MDESYLKKMAKDWHGGTVYGIMSACTASPLCIEAAMLASKKKGLPVLVEATSNQVNQFGGYTGMRPADYFSFVKTIAEKAGMPMENVILGGDHLGPQPFKNEAEGAAMKKAEDLVYEYAAAGFSKIHLDTSMRLASDDRGARLPDEIIAERALRLAQSAVAGFKEYKSRCREARMPVFVIGSEVPVPGGSQEAAEGIEITKPEDLDATVNAFKSAFVKNGLDEVWDNVIGVVVQPGVEFGDTELHLYNPEKAKRLLDSIRKYAPIVFEGHSTDYQTPLCLKHMVHDGICILKVGPGLTFYQREAIFALSAIEKELLQKTGKAFSAFPEVLEKSMLDNPTDWEKYYHGTPEEQYLKRKYSYSDRCRYYLPQPEVVKALEALIANLSGLDIPITVLSQFMPIQAFKVRTGEIGKDPHSLIISRITDLIDEYLFALASK